MSEVMLKVKSGSVPASQASIDDLEWYATSCKNQRLRDAAATELDRRRGGGGGGAPRQQQRPAARQQQAIQRHTPDALVGGAISDSQKVTQRLRTMSAEYHLVSPATSCDALPPGCGVAITLVSVNGQSDEVYSVGGGKYGLSGHALKRIGAAAGIDWDPQRSGRLDDGRDPHYVHYRAVGTVKNFDGSSRAITGEVEIDMRDDSPQVDAMRQRTSSQKGFDSQLRDTRLFILRHAETKAKLRAIADMGVKRSYTKEELDKPFAIARLMWTGETNDPELKREFARMHAQHMISGSAALYGNALPAARPAPLPEFAGHPPPPAGSVPADYEEYPTAGAADYEAHGEELPRSEPRASSEPEQRDDTEDRGDDPERY